MAITVSNVQQNHRSLYWEYTGDGATTASSATFPLHLHGKQTAVATVTTGPTTFESGHRGGLNYPTNGTNVPVASCTISGNTITVTTSAAVGNGTKAYVVAVLNEYTD